MIIVPYKTFYVILPSTKTPFLQFHQLLSCYVVPLYFLKWTVRDIPRPGNKRKLFNNYVRSRGHLETLAKELPTLLLVDKVMIVTFHKPCLVQGVPQISSKHSKHQLLLITSLNISNYDAFPLWWLPGVVYFSRSSQLLGDQYFFLLISEPFRYVL